MHYNEYNNDFLSFNGKISRKNYIINMLILVALYIAVSLIRFESFSKFFSFEFFNTILIWLIELFKFALVIAIMSLIYRRMADFSKLNENMNKLFFVLFLFPFLYVNWGHYLLSFLPFLLQILDILTVFVLLPLALLSSLIFAFLKSKKQ